MSEKSFVPEPFSDVEKERMLKDAKANEYRHRALTQGEASEDTEAVFNEQERVRSVQEASPKNYGTMPPTPEEIEAARTTETSARWIKKIRNSLKEKGAYEEGVDYERPPSSTNNN